MIVPNNPNPFSSTIHYCYCKHSSTIDALAFANPVGEFFRVLELEFWWRVLKFFCSSPPSLGRRMKPSRCSTGGFSSLKRIFRASQTWKLPICIFVCWKVLQHSMHKFCNGVLHNLETRTLCWMCTTFLKSWNWFMKPILWGLHHV